MMLAVNTACTFNTHLLPRFIQENEIKQKQTNRLEGILLQWENDVKQLKN